MAVKEIGDPRLQALFGTTDPRDAGVRPTVRLPRKGMPPYAIAAIAFVFAVLLFLVLEERRSGQAQPNVEPRPSDNPASVWAAPPPLYVPPTPQPLYAPPAPEQEVKAPPLAAPTPAPAAKPVAAPAAPPAIQPAPQILPAPAPPPQHVSSGSPLVIDTSAGTAASSAGTGSGAATSSGDPDAVNVRTVSRMQASAFENRSMTVPQGYLIPAVLETGFDSTKPGFARAIVSRDVRGFDGKNVLIPRGSRLIGEYKSAIAQSQNRAIITWTRLIRPDGMTIMMNSPAVDTVGRGGVAASVNSHFFARLGNALLQSSFAIGQALAGRSTTGPVVVLQQGNAATTAAQVAAPVRDYTPTLKVPPGRSISIFVAQDLDFSAAGAAR